MSLLTRLLFLSLATPGLAQANELMRIYELALRNDASLIAARHSRDAALQTYPQARALLLPQVSGSYSQTYNDSEIDVSFPDPATGASVPINRENTGTDKSLSVSLNQTLFSLESWYQLKQASEQAALAHLSYRASEQALLLRVSEAYFGTLAAENRLRSAKAEQEALQRQLDLANKNLEVGLASITDTEEVQARYDLSVATALEAEQGLTAARLQLAQLTRKPLTRIEPPGVQVVELPGVKALPPLREELPLPRPMPASVDPWVDQARSTNLDLLAAQLDFKVAVRGVEIAQARHLPTLGATASYSDARSGGGTFPTTISGTAVSIGVTVPLFAGGATQAGLRQAVATREQKLAEYDARLRAVEAEVRNAFQGVSTGASRVAALKLAAASSRRALVAAETGLSIGTRAALDVLNARQQRYTAERNYDQSRYDYLLSVLRLKSAAGRLSLKDLSEIDALLVGG